MTLVDAQEFLDMPDGSSEILGFIKNGDYNFSYADSIKASFPFQDSNDPYRPVVKTLKDYPDMYFMLITADWTGLIIIGIFVFIMAIVLWNAGLLNGMRRYGEIGLRRAIGESSKNIYLNLILEAALIGLIGSALGTVVGIIPSYYLQTNGIDISDMMNNQGATMMVSDVLYAKVTLKSYFVGFIPGILANILGAAIAGLTIFKRETAQLFKELEK